MMKPQYDNRTLSQNTPNYMPSKRELDREEFEHRALKFVKQYYKIEDVFDTYNHDKGVVKAFCEWLEKNVMLYGGLWTDDTNPYDAEAKIYSFDEMWEKFNLRTGKENQ